MILNYLKLKYVLYKNRYDEKDKAVFWGESVGTLCILSLISFICYLIFKNVLNFNFKSISTILGASFILVTVISLIETFKFSYNSYFISSHRHMLFMFPMTNKEIIIIRYLESIVSFFKIYIFFHIPILVASVIINKDFLPNSLLLLLMLLMLSIIIISLINILLIGSVYLSNGKNISLTAFLLSLVIVLFVYITIIFYPDNLSIEMYSKKEIFQLILLPITLYIKIITTELSFNFVILAIIKMLLFTIIFFTLSSYIISKSIDKGLLLIDPEKESHRLYFYKLYNNSYMDKFLNSIIKSNYKTSIISIIKKDLLTFYSDKSILGFVIPPTVVFILINLKNHFSPTGVDLLIVLNIINFWICISILFYSIENEMGNFTLILNSGLPNESIFLSKSISNILSLMPISFIISTLISLIHKTSLGYYLMFIIFIQLNLILSILICTFFILKNINVTTSKVEITSKAKLNIALSLIILLLSNIIIFLLIKYFLNSFYVIISLLILISLIFIFKKSLISVIKNLIKKLNNVYIEIL